MKAILSTFDRTGLVDFAKSLQDVGYELVSTGGTGKELSDAGLRVTQVSDLTGFPEIMDGRVKTLHPKIHGGILARRDVPEDIAQMAEHGIEPIDLVVGGLYPFVETVSKPDATLDDALENIDIGGPTMIRAAAKNFPHVVIVVDPADYGWVAEKLAGDGLSVDERRKLAQKAFQHVALYDTAISRHLDQDGALASEGVTFGYDKQMDLRYGENPHQQGALYADLLTSGGIVGAKQLHGPELSLTNILDADGAWTTVNDFDDPAVCVVKHTNPCGLAVHDDQTTAYQRAYEGDSISAYGGIVGFNRTVTAATVQAMKGVLYHVIVAPDYEPEALELFKKRKQARVLQVEPERGPIAGVDVRRVSGGALIQTVDDIEEDASSWKVVTERKPTKAQLRDLAFAWKASKHIKSNTIVLAKDSTLVGMGTGQPNRVTSVHLALRIAGEKAKDSVMASDAYMPFADNVEMAATGGIVAVAQPGGSLRDEEVIEAANKHGLAMVFTGVRHFKH